MAKDIEFDCHFMWDEGDRKFLLLPHVPSNLQFTEIFIKAMTCDCHLILVCKLMLFDPPALILGTVKR